MTSENQLFCKSLYNNKIWKNFFYTRDGTRDSVLKKRFGEI